MYFFLFLIFFFFFLGTELNGSLAVGNPLSPTFAGGELPGPPLGLDVDVVDPNVSPIRSKCNSFCAVNLFACVQTLERIVEREGELACFSAAPNMPLRFVGDKNNDRYRSSYFSRDPRIWIHGDYSVRTVRGGFFILGRSDATLNPGGVRIGTRDYYSVVEQVPGVRDAVVVGVANADGDEEVALFVVLDAAADADKVLVFC
jgi:acetoacetyl-CoA synthetase